MSVHRFYILVKAFVKLLGRLLHRSEQGCSSIDAFHFRNIVIDLSKGLSLRHSVRLTLALEQIPDAFVQLAPHRLLLHSGRRRRLHIQGL